MFNARENAIDPMDAGSPGASAASVAQALPRLRNRTSVRSASAVRAVLLPVALVAAVVGFALANRLHHYGGNPTGFVQFGSVFTPFTHPPRDAIVGTNGSSHGYDGQFYYVIARDPLLIHDSTVASLRDAPQDAPSEALGSANQAYRFQRVAYPALAFLSAKALGLSIPWSLLVVNVLMVLLLVAGFAYYAWRRGWSTLWAVALGLFPGLLLSMLRDLPTPLAVACSLGGILAWTSSRRRLAVPLLVVAVLAREETLVVVLALAIETAVRAWNVRGTPGAARRIARDAWPAVVLPTVAFAAWHVYVSIRTGGSMGGAGITVPLVHFISQLRAATTAPAGMLAWEVAYLLLMIAAVAASVRSVRRGVTITSVAAALFALTFLFAPFNDVWGQARDSVPMLALLLVIGLERRESALLGICVLAAAMTAVIPFAIPGTF